MATVKMQPQIRILMLEDNPADVKLSQMKLTSSGFAINCDVARNSREFMQLMEPGKYDLILADFRLPDWTGIEALRWVKSEGYTTPFILVTGTVGDELAVQAIKDGARDYVLKDKLERLPVAIRNVMEEELLREERNRAARLLRQSESHFRSIIESAPYGICQFDSRNRLRMANPALVSMLGYEAEDQLIGIPFDIQVFQKPEECAAVLASAHEEFVTSEHEVSLLRHDGSAITVRMAARCFHDAAGELICECFIENVTERRLLERQMQQMQKMEALGRLAGGIAHDFNNLLMIVQSYADLLVDQAQNAEKVKTYAGHIQNAGGKAATVVRQLLAFSREHVREVVVLNMNAVVEDLAKLLPRLLGEDVEMKISLNQELGKVSADAGQLEQVIVNLAVNARDAMPQGGVITIRTENVEITGGPQDPPQLSPGNYAVVSVSDTGIGMDAKTQARIFEPFFTTKDKYKGTGLGLATVFGIVQQSGGIVHVLSAPDEGATFSIYLPRVEVITSKNTAAASHVIVPGGTETVLLVEDSAALREVCSRFLQSRGYQVIEAGSGIEAMQICNARTESFDVLVTDMVMPGLGGVEVAKEIERIQPGTPVIYISGYSDRELDKDSLSPLSAVLQKPFALDKLAFQLRDLLDRYPRLQRAC